MDYHWKDIYSEFSEAQNATLSEKDFQHRISSIFKLYLRWSNNIVAEENIHIGSAHSIRPDFVLYQDDVPQVVIEAKKPVHSQTVRNREQLYSYMRQKKVDFGLYIGECIQLYYDNPEDKEIPNLIFTINYDSASPFGDDFVRLFTYDSFSEMDLKAFCEQKLKEIVTQQELQSERDKLISDSRAQYVKELLSVAYSSKGYTSEWIGKILDGLMINISEEVNTSLAPMNNQETSPKLYIKPMKNSTLDYTHYTIDGQGDYGKGELAWECFNLYQSKKGMTFAELQREFGRKIKSLSEINEWKKSTSDKSKDTRWFEQNFFVSSDGIKYALTTQIGKGNISFYIDLAKKIGHVINPK